MFRGFFCAFIAIFLIASTALMPPQIRTIGSRGTKLQAYGDDEKPAISLGGLVVLSVGIVGVFGTGFLSTFKDVAGAFKEDTSAPIIKNDAGERNRGAKTKLTKREINNKLSQVPVFYVVSSGSNTIYTKDAVGYFFMDKADAEAYAKANSGVRLEVSATSLDDAFFTLIQKKTKLGTFIDGVAATADPTAQYVLYPSAREVDNATPEWRQKHGPNDVPLFRVATLAFSKENGLEFPLFTHKEDALNAFERLQASKPKAEDAAASPADVQLTSILDLVQLWGSGGFEGRALEIYPAMEAIEAARELMK